MRAPAVRRLDFISNNWLYKLVALVVALAIWLTTLYGQKNAILIRSMELDFLMRPNFVAKQFHEKYVQIEVEGPRHLLNKFSQSANVITINLTNETEGEKKIAIRPSDVNLPIGLKLVSLSPPEIDVMIQEVKRP
jgi:YbbR domain-containing protein